MRDMDFFIKKKKASAKIKKINNKHLKSQCYVEQQKLWCTY